MNVLINLILLTVIVSTAYCYEQYIGNAKHPDFPGKCYSRDHKRPIAIGETFRPTNTGECHKITCREDFVLRIDSCPRFQVGDNCRVISGNLSKPYPKCCAQLDCIDSNGNNEIRPTHNEYRNANSIKY